MSKFVDIRQKQKWEKIAHYRKLQARCETVEAQKDLQRLAVVRKEREEAAKKRELERKQREDALHLKEQEKQQTNIGIKSGPSKKHKK